MAEPVFKPIPKRDVPTPAEKQARWEEKQRRKYPSWRRVTENDKKG